MLKYCALFLLLYLSPLQIVAQEIKLKTIAANDLKFTCRLIGDPQTQPLVVLLHGFPETSHMWESTMQHLAQKGYACLAPDMRGYSPEARPKGSQNYSIQILASDVVALVKETGAQDFHLIGHDWGAAIGWAMLALYPDQIQSSFLLSIPHLKAFGEAIKNDPKQRKKSNYARLFQLRGIPELVLRSNNFARLKESCWYLSSPEQIAAYRETFSGKRALATSLHYYRKNWSKMLAITNEIGLNEVQIPTTLVWGKNDQAVEATGILATANYMKGPYKLVQLEAGHWLIQEVESKIFELLDQHLNTASASTK